MEDSEDLLKVVANETNRRLLLALVPEPGHSRHLAEALGLNETEVSRRLKKLEKAGLVRGQWVRTDANVKRYQLLVDGMEVRFATGGIEIALRHKDRETATVAGNVPVWSFELPTTPAYVARPEFENVLASTDARVVVLMGVAGVGKTFLAASAARANAGPVFWHTLRPTDTFGRLYHRAAAFLQSQGRSEPLRIWGEGVRDVDALTRALRDAFDSVNALVVLDDYHAVKEDEAIALVHGLIRDLASTRVLVTSRERPRYLPPHVPHQVVAVEGFSLEEAARFLDVKGVKLPAAELARVHESTHGHPILLNLYAEAQLAGGRTADAPAAASDHQHFFWDTFYATLSEEERRVLEAASIWHSRFTRDAIQAVLPGESVDKRLYSLEKRLLLTRRGDDGFMLHDLLRGFAYETARGKQRLHSLAAQYCQSLGTVTGHLEAIDHRLRAGEPEKAAALLTRNLDLTELEVVSQGHHALYREILDRFKEADVPRDLWTVILDERGDLAFTTGSPAEALRYYDAVEARVPEKDAATRADIAWKRALSLQAMGKKEDARAAAEAGLRVAPSGSRPEERLRDLLKQIA